LIPGGEKAKAIHFPHDFNAYVIEAIKALDAENWALSDTLKEQEATIAALQRQNADLEARIVALEAQVEALLRAQKE
jgi:septal ring factor EnvC (AmiA/AmiB activator)